MFYRLSGGELFDRLVQQDFDFTEDDCITYMRQICEGVRHMHRQNILHLDLKVSHIGIWSYFNALTYLFLIILFYD